MEPEKDIFDQWKDEKENQSWIKRKIERISLWWRFDGRFYHKDFIQGVKNIWKWLPIIWKDRDWDHSYIYNILQHKLKNQATYIGSKGFHINATRDAEVMKTCVRLIDKCKDEFYSSEYTDYHKTKHWFEPCEGKEGYSTWESRELEETFDEYFKKYPLIYKRAINGEGVFKLDDKKDKQRIAMNIAHINEERAHKLLFKIMEQNIRGWWD